MELGIVESFPGGSPADAEGVTDALPGDRPAAASLPCLVPDLLPAGFVSNGAATIRDGVLDHDCQHILGLSKLAEPFQRVCTPRQSVYDGCLHFTTSTSSIPYVSSVPDTQEEERK